MGEGPQTPLGSFRDRPHAGPPPGTNPLFDGLDTGGQQELNDFLDSPVPSLEPTGRIQEAGPSCKERWDFVRANYRDVYFAIGFFAHLCFILFLGIGLHASGGVIHFGDQTMTGNSIFIELIFTMLSAVAVSVGFIQMLTRATAGTIAFMYFSPCVALFAMAVAQAVFHNWWTFTAYIIGTGVCAWYTASHRNRLRFAIALFTKALELVRMFPAMALMAYLLQFALVLWLLVWCFALTGALQAEDSSGYISVLAISLFWTVQVVHNTVRVTAAGVVGTWYYQTNNVPPNPTKEALHRSCTTSFGSICFGSAFVTIIQSLRSVLSTAQAQTNYSHEQGITADPNQVGEAIKQCCFACNGCCLSAVSSLQKFFNKYAFAQVGVYGKKYIEASKHVWALFEERSLIALVNDEIVSSILFLASVVGGVVVGTATGFFVLFARSEVDGTFAMSIGTIAFFLAAGIITIPLAVVDAISSTLFVCYAEDPMRMSSIDLDMYNLIDQQKVALGGFIGMAIPMQAQPQPDGSSGAM